MPGWQSYQHLIEQEFLTAREEGHEPSLLETLGREFEAAPSNEAALAVFYAQMQQRLAVAPLRPDFAFEEPNDLADIRRLRADGVRSLACDLSETQLLDKLHGAWLGRCVGCALGKPLECFMGEHNGLASWQRQKRYLQAIAPEEWPLRDYVPQHSPAEAETGSVQCHPSTREEIAFMETDDDIRYTVLGQIILRQHGPHFTTWAVARAWIEHLPYQQVCTAETQAYRNLVKRYNLHFDATSDSEFDWGWIATHDNPFREWIGAQIRADVYGYAASGRPALAAEWAWRDARLSHVKNGLYGAMLCAAMIAAAFATSDPRAIVEAGLAEIPHTSRLYMELRQVVTICERYHCDFASLEAVIAEIYAFGALPPGAYQ